MDKVYSMQEQMDDVRTEAEILRKNRKEMEKIKNTLRGTKHASRRLIADQARLDHTPVRVCPGPLHTPLVGAGDDVTSPCLMDYS